MLVDFVYTPHGAVILTCGGCTALSSVRLQQGVARKYTATTDPIEE